MFAGRGMAVLQCANRSMAGSVSMPVAVAARAAANRTAVPGPQPTSTTRSAPVNSAASATARTRGPCPAAIHSAVMTRQARPAIPAPARRVLVLLIVDHRPSGRRSAACTQRPAKWRVLTSPANLRRGVPDAVRSRRHVQRNAESRYLDGLVARAHSEVVDHPLAGTPRRESSRRFGDPHPQPPVLFS